MILRNGLHFFKGGLHLLRHYNNYFPIIGGSHFSEGGSNIIIYYVLCNPDLFEKKS